MKTNSSAQQYIEQAKIDLPYEKNEVQGECLLLRITPVVISTPFFVLYIICSILFVPSSLNSLVVHWQFRYPQLKRVFYYRPSPLDQAKYFHIINYDETSSYCQKLEAKFYFTQSYSSDVIYFVNRYLTYLIQNNVVRPATFDFISRCNLIMESPNIQKNSYNDQSAYHLRESYGPGVMQLKFPSIPILFIRQVMRPLYLFLLFSCALWFYQLYYYFTAAILVSALLGIIGSLYLTYKNNKKMHKMAYHQQEIQVIRFGEVRKLSSKELVPGDIVFLKKQIKIPFDGIILEGQVLINQCALTGQSAPVLKKAEKLLNNDNVKIQLYMGGLPLFKLAIKGNLQNLKTIVKNLEYQLQFQGQTFQPRKDN